MSRILSWFLIALLVAGGAFALLEVALRATEYSKPILYRADPQLGWSLRPGARGLYNDEGMSRIRISPAGMRDRTHPLAKPEDVYRVAVLGDSHAEAMQVDFKDTFWWQLEERLEQCRLRPGKRVEVMNFGVRGYGLSQALAVLESRAMRYAPDLVLLTMSNADEFRAPPTSLVKLPAPWRELVWAASERLRTVQFANEHYHRFAQKSRLHAAGQPAAQDPETLLARIQERAKRGGAAFALAIVPHPLQVHPDARQRRAAPELVGRQQALEAFSRKRGITMVPLLEPMQRLSREEGVHLHGFRNASLGQGHWNERGHRAAAELIARRLCPPA
jgi:hypothetical protein